MPRAPRRPARPPWLTSVGKREQCALRFNEWPARRRHSKTATARERPRRLVRRATAAPTPPSPHPRRPACSRAGPGATAGQRSCAPTAAPSASAGAARGARGLGTQARSAPRTRGAPPVGRPSPSPTAARRAPAREDPGAGSYKSSQPLSAASRARSAQSTPTHLRRHGPRCATLAALVSRQQLRFGVEGVPLPRVRRRRRVHGGGHHGRPLVARAAAGGQAHPRAPRGRGYRPLPQRREHRRRLPGAKAHRHVRGSRPGPGRPGRLGTLQSRRTAPTQGRGWQGSRRRGRPRCRRPAAGRREGTVGRDPCQAQRRNRVERACGAQCATRDAPRVPVGRA